MRRLWRFTVGIIIPFVAIVGLFPWYNRVSPEVLGFPFLYFWLFLWFVLTTLCLFIVWRTDPRYRHASAPEREDSSWQ